MRRETIGEIVFWGAVACGLALYAQTAPEGLPWRPAVGNRYWRYLVAMADGDAVRMASVLAAVSAGLLGAIVNRSFGWRVGAAVALAWLFLPAVWNRAILGDGGLAFAATLVVLLWLVNALFLFATGKVRAARRQKRLAFEIDENGAEAAHDAEMRRAAKNRKTSRAILGAAVLFAVFSASQHDYRLGEAASAYARLVVEEADGRIIVANGLADEQIEREVKSKSEKGKSAEFAFLTLGNDARDTGHEARGTNLVAWAKREWPGETNLWVAAQIGPRAFADVAVRAHPERFYTMTGLSTTPERWLARWTAMKPYLASNDPFIPAMRRAFAYEGNALGNGLLERKVVGGDGKAGGESRPTEEDAQLSKKAWAIYWRVFDEIEPKNPAACVNLNEMLRHGYVTDTLTRQRIESAKADFAKKLRNKRVREEFPK